MHPFDEMKSWVGFGPDDEARLRALRPVVQPHLEDLSDTFYARILAHPEAARVLRDQAQVERLKGTLRRWADELLAGPWDEDYYQRRERIGRVHVQVGLPSRYMFTAMNVFRTGLCAVAEDALPPHEAAETCRSIGKVADMDLAIMTGTYLLSREQSQMAALQEVIVSHLPVTVLLLDGEGRVTAATRPAARLAGEGPIVGRPLADVLPKALVESARLPDLLASAEATGESVVLPRVDASVAGEDRVFRVTVVPLDHPLARALVHIGDITDTVAAEIRLLRAESLAQLGALSAAVAHELRNPLAGISGAIQVISRSLPAEDRRKPIMDKVEQQVRRLDSLVTDLLDFARPTDARMSAVQLEEVARQVIENLHRENPDVSLEAVGSGVAWADPNLVHQVLLNLAINAVQAMGGNGRVRIELKDGWVRVSDTGPGVPPEHAEKIFAPFFTTRTKGTGLGLAICRKAAQAMGGTLELAEEGPFPGAAFQLRLQTPSD
ncbi:MAG: protoglobin domain-containing protein [Myxococcota bacterium]